MKQANNGYKENKRYINQFPHIVPLAPNETSYIFVSTFYLRIGNVITLLILFSRYFFHVLAALIVIGFLNGIVLFPVILSLIGPNSEVQFWFT